VPDSDAGRPRSRCHSAQICLDLGDVKNIAQVTVNGRTLDPVWHPLFRVNVKAPYERDPIASRLP